MRDHELPRTDSLRLLLPLAADDGGNPIATRVDAQGYMGMDYGMLLAVVTRPGIESIEDLRGGTVSVDAPDSGFAYVLYKDPRPGRPPPGRGLRGRVDRRRGRPLSEPHGDRRFRRNPAQRRLRDQGEERGYALLDSVYDIADPYLGAWAAAKSSWLRENAELAAAFIAAYRKAVRWCFDPANREACLDRLMQAPQTPRSLAEQLYQIQLRPGVGNVPDAGIPADGVLNVLKLREELGGFEDQHDLDAMAGPDGDLYDLAYHRAAVATEA